ncbi:hypothetical protein ACFL3S_02720 [Gemmatimonadota bacterium]
MTDETELTQEEKMAFQRLPKEAEPSDLLEERTVRALRAEGLLRHWRSAPSSSRWLRPWMVAGSVAASLVLFASGMVLGQWMGARSTSEVFLAVREQDVAQLALQIQEAGSAYVAALAALGELRSDGAPAAAEEDLVRQASDFQQGREVALGALYGAAYELARLTPEDADVLRVLQILEARRDREAGLVGDSRDVVWF